MKKLLLKGILIAGGIYLLHALNKGGNLIFVSLAIYLAAIIVSLLYLVEGVMKFIGWKSPKFIASIPLTKEMIAVFMIATVSFFYQDASLILLGVWLYSEIVSDYIFADSPWDSIKLIVDEDEKTKGAV